MLDFMMVSTRTNRAGGIEVFPKFLVKRSTDLMIRGGDFYAVWVEELGLWSTDEFDAIRLIDQEVSDYFSKMPPDLQSRAKAFYVWDAENGMIDRWHAYCQRQCRDNYHMLDESLTFSNDQVKKNDYISKRLSYPLEEGSHDAWDKLIGTLYTPEERHKIEWAIGSIVTGDSKRIQKFLVLYGPPGSGKSTLLNIIQMLFDGYCSVFDSKALASASNQFALESFKSNPLVAIQHDGDLSHIEDNTRLNSLVSHEVMVINEKHKSLYEAKFRSFLLLGSNKPVQITDARSGILRRLIDVSPSGGKVPLREYNKLTKQVTFELGAIAAYCRDVYLDAPEYYDSYIPKAMMTVTNPFYNFMQELYVAMDGKDGITIKDAWDMYKGYCEEANIYKPLPRNKFKEEICLYFHEYYERYYTEDGQRVRGYLRNIKTGMLDGEESAVEEKLKPSDEGSKWLDFKQQSSIFDTEAALYPAQYATTNETPALPWKQVKTQLRDLDTSKLHYVKVPVNHIVIDFDLKVDGKKNFQKNLEAASKWPPTYAELSKSGQGIHLHYLYSGDPTRLSRVYDEYIEVKVFNGGSSLRRMLTLCNDIPVAPISSGLPLKEEKPVVNLDKIKTEKGLRIMLLRNINKEIHADTRSSVDFIYKILEDAYDSGMKYDVSDLSNAVLGLAASSTNQSKYCIKLVNKMHFKSAEPVEMANESTGDNDPLVFFDCEVYPNLLLINWKQQGEGKTITRMINPSPLEVKALMNMKLVGFNCRRYDNHILYARMLGYTNEQIFELSQNIVSNKRSNAMFGSAYDISYTDVYDFCSKKQSLKKWEIELGIHHQEMSLPWDQPVPEELWEKVAEYCDNDVLATEAVFNKNQGDFAARQIQVELVHKLHGMRATVNDTTNTLSGRIIFGKNKSPQSQFNYRDLSQPVPPSKYKEYRELFGPDYQFHVFDSEGLPIYEIFDPSKEYPEDYSILPFFKGYKFERGVSTYLGVEIGEGGKVFGAPGMYGDLWDGDVASMHPHSMIFEVVFGPEYTKTLEELVDARVAIKHHDFELAATYLNGALTPYLTEELADSLAQALKIVINSIYGLTSAKFENLFRDPRNIDNIVAKRGSLFMTLLKQEVENLGYKVAHIKTDSIKIPDADDRIRDFVIKFGMEYGYKFETEAEFEKFCLVNNSVYIAKYKTPKKDKKTGEPIWWTATGAQFAVPYVFKTLFSHKEVTFNDFCETFAVQNSALFLDFNESMADVSDLEKQRKKLIDKYRDKQTGEWTDNAVMATVEGLDEDIAKGHSLQFVGRIGQFTPVQAGHGGGILLRKNTDKFGNIKYDSAGGADGYRWMESETIRGTEMERCIDMRFYTSQVDAAIAEIAKYGDAEWFISDDPYIPQVHPWQEADQAWSDDSADKLFAVR